MTKIDTNKLNLQRYTSEIVKKYLLDLKGHQAKNLYSFIIDQIEKGIISEVLEFTGGNRTKASEILGITRTTLRSKIKKHQL